METVENDSSSSNAAADTTGVKSSNGTSDSREANGASGKPFTTVNLDDSASPPLEGISLGEPQVFQPDVVPVAKRLSEIKTWGVTHIKCKRQMLSERFGKGSRTIDVELNEKIQALRDTQRRYQEVILLTRKLLLQVRSHTDIQRNLGDSFAEYSIRSPELREEFKSNSDLQRQVARHGEMLASVLEAFASNVQTLVSKTMDDTLLKVKDYEAARVEYDAFRADLESLRSSFVQTPSNASKKARLEERERDLEVHKGKYDQMRSDLSVKLRFLDENRVKVMQKQLALLHNATCAYYTGNTKQLDECIQKFHIKIPPREGQVGQPVQSDISLSSLKLLPMASVGSPETSQPPEEPNKERTALY